MNNLNRMVRKYGSLNKASQNYLYVCTPEVYTMKIHLLDHLVADIKGFAKISYLAKYFKNNSSFKSKDHTKGRVKGE